MYRLGNGNGKRKHVLFNYLRLVACESVCLLVSCGFIDLIDSLID